MQFVHHKNLLVIDLETQLLTLLKMKTLNSEWVKNGTEYHVKFIILSYKVTIIHKPY